MYTLVEGLRWLTLQNRTFKSALLMQWVSQCTTGCHSSLITHWLTHVIVIIGFYS